MADTHCIVIPHYRHVPQLARFLPELEKVGLPLLVVDDGSGEESVLALRELLKSYPWTRLHERKVNGGKGAATITGLDQAQVQGFSHIILVDADGQHDPTDVAKMLKESMAYPNALFSGHPQFGDDIPAARRYGREITNVLARLESGNFQLADAMCGLRAYPIAATRKLCAACGYRQRMEMDTELLVRACWQGLEVRYIKTEVVYPEEGASHFRMGKDNLRMAAMHIILLLGAIVRVPLARLRASGNQ